MACLAACALSAAFSAGASAAQTLSFESSIARAINADSSLDLSSGSHPYALTAGFALKTTTDSGGRLDTEGGDLRDVIAELPAGLAVNPLAVQGCGLQQFTTIDQTTGQDGCSDASAVGVIALEYVVPSTLAERKTLRAPLYELAPAAGSPALLGFVFEGMPMPVVASLRTTSDYGLTLTIAGIPQGARMFGSTVTLWGVPAESAHDGERGSCVQSHATCPAGIPAKPLISMPTQCASAPVLGLRVDSWQAPEQYATASSSLVEGSPSLASCEALDFSPTLQTHAESSVADTPTGFTVDVHLPQSEDPSALAEADLQDAVVALPGEVALNLSRASTLVGCPLEGAEGVNLASSEPSHCPQASQVGSVTLGTPLFSGPLHGGLYLAQQGNLASNGTNPFGSLLALYAVVEGAGAVVKLPLQVSADPQSGELSLHLGPDPATGQDHAPQLPFEDIAFEFEDGEHALLVTPTVCGDHAVRASLTPWSGSSPATPSDQIHVTEGCAKAFEPSLSADTADKQGNAYSPLTITLARKDGEGELRSVAMRWPVGLLANISHVALCPEPQASLGTCGPDSLIGEASVSAGVGAQPLAIQGGKVYLTGPYGGGPFGVSLVIPAVAGPLDLGPEGHPIVIRATVGVDRLTGQITVASDLSGPYAIPNMLQGVDLQIRSIAIALNRPQFTSNPSGCAPLALLSTITSVQWAAASVSSPMQSTNCLAVPFGPKFSASTIGKPSRTNGIGLDVKIVEGYPHEANAHYVKVQLPKQLPARLSTLQKACPSDVFEANPAACPPGAVIGTATTVTSLLPVPLVGPVYFVAHGGAKFPEVVMVMQGYGVTIESHGETFIDKAGVTSTTFPNVPEAPIPSFELRLPPGPGSALSAHGDLCAKSMHMVTTIVSYNTREIKETPPVLASGCHASKAKITVVHRSLRGRVLTLVVKLPYAGKLTALARGLASKAKKVAKAGVVTLKLRLSKHGLRLLAHKDRHHKRRHLIIRLTLTSSHGSTLSARVRVP